MENLLTVSNELLQHVKNTTINEFEQVFPMGTAIK